MKYRNKKIKKRWILLIGALIILGILYYGNNTVGVSRYYINSEKVPAEFNGFKILQLSDLHSKEFGKNNERLIRKIDKEQPDVIVMTGDMVNSFDEHYEVFYDLARNLAKRYPVYFIVGNHEQILGDPEIKQFLESNGISVLDNTVVKLERDNSHINLYGLWFHLKYYKDKNNPYTKDIYYDVVTMQKTLGGTNPQEYNVLLTHNPMYFPTYAQWGADLTLAGHVHGGVIIVPFKGGLLSPEREFFPEYYGGLYVLDECKMVVNRGLGSAQFGLRIFNRPEISVITLENTP